MPLEPIALHPDVAERLLALNGPSLSAEPGHLPMRGDLAHIKLAGRYFVPHYAVPMAHAVVSATALRASPVVSADVVCEMAAGGAFDVLDIAGGWAWGQFGDDGPVGYAAMSDLEAS